MSRKINFIILSLLIWGCRPKEDVGLAQYFISNQSDYTIAVKCTYIQSVEVTCDSCTIGNHSENKLGQDANFGHAPHPNETIKTIKIYKNDTLKISLNTPYADSVFKNEKGSGEYDWNYKFTIENSDLQ